MRYTHAWGDTPWEEPNGDYMSDCSMEAWQAPHGIEGYLQWKDGGRNELHYTRYLDGNEREADFFELDGVKFVPERTCTVIGTRFEDLLDEYCHSLSCGHDAWNRDSEPPRYCEECGARVKEAN